MKPNPPDFYPDKLHGAVSEIISAMSSLNMEPSPITDAGGTYLSETDTWAKHSMEHLHAALNCLRVYQENIARERSKTTREVAS